jgi:hypothetical protein
LLLHCTAKFIVFLSHFQILATFGLSVKGDGEAKSFSVRQIRKFLGPKYFITFFTRKGEVGHLMLVHQPQRLLNIKQDVPQLKFKHMCKDELSKKGSYIYIV